MKRDEFIHAMHVMNKVLNMADKCQPVMMQYLSEQPTALPDMNELDFIGVWPTLAMILQPVIKQIEEFQATELYKAVAAEPDMHVPGLIIPE